MSNPVVSGPLTTLQGRGRCCRIQISSGADNGHTYGTDVNPAATKKAFTTTETKPSYKTTELIAYLVAVIGVLIASAMVDRSDFGAQEAWFYITLPDDRLHDFPWASQGWQL
jgi:hypothetical protein